MAEVFKDYAKYYNLLYKDKDYLGEVKYVENLIRQYAKEHSSSILDLGCGSGLHDLLLARLGYSVTGVDLSPEMLEAAILNTPNELVSKLSFINSDVRTLTLSTTFDVVISLFHVASYQNSNDDLIQYFNTASAHLDKGGVFIFDFWYGPGVLHELPTDRKKYIDDNDIKITRLSTPSIDYARNIVDVGFEMIVEDKNKGVSEVIFENHSMRYLFIPEIVAFLKQADLEILKVSPWMGNGELTKENWYGLIIAKKQND